MLPRPRDLAFFCLTVGLAAAEPAGADVRILHSHTRGPGSPVSGLLTDGFGSFYGTTRGGGDGDAGTVYTVRADGSGFRILHSFAWNGTEGGDPEGSLVLDNLGNLYGTTARGGEGAGTIFTLRTDGSGYRVLRPFSGPTTLRVLPSLLLDELGSLYGMTSDDGGAGTLFRIKTDGSGFTILHAFSYIFGPGLDSSLATDGTGALYGVAPMGGPGGGGTIWAIGMDGSNYRVLHNFGVTAANGLTPNSNLVVDSSGWLLGTTSGGGSGGAGVVFRLAADGSAFSVLAGLSAGSGPGAAGWVSLTLDAGVLFGASVPGQTLATDPTVFRIGTDGRGFAVLHSFGSTTNPDNEIAGRPLLFGNGTLIGASRFDAATSAGTIFSMGRDGSSFRTLFDFNGLNKDGLTPRAPLVLDAAGNLYGTTSWPGSVFTVRTDGSGYRILHAFNGGAADGYVPMAGLTLDSSGNLYGTTQNGGPSDLGTVFALRTDGTQFRLLRGFSGNDGESPVAPLLLGSGGNLYGTAQYGGSNFAGTIFSLNPDGSSFRVIRSLSPGEGGAPLAGLVQDASGRLYGTTSTWGRGAGTVFSVMPDGSDFKVLHDFGDVSSDGQFPSAPLLLDDSGSLYGTTPTGVNAANPGLGGNGTIFTLRTDGTGYQILHVFDGSDGAYPVAPLVGDPWGNLYGTTSRTWLPAYTGGEVFTLRPDGSAFRVLHDFGSVWPDAAGPTAGLVRDPIGNLYGTTSSGGTAGGGAEFVLKDICSAAPDITVVSGSNPTCLGSSLTLDAGDGFATYLWSTGATTRTITVSPSTAATYTVAGTVAGCPGPIPAGSITAGVTSAIPPTPVPTNDGPKCEGQTVQLMVDLVPGATYAWTGPNGFASSQPLPAIGYASAAASGDYSVTLTVGGCTSAPGTTAVVVRTRPSTPVITSPAAVLAWATFVASVPPLPGITYSWYVLSGGTLVSGQDTESVTVQSHGQGALILLVMATDVATGCTSFSSGQASIHVLAGPMFNTLTPCRALDSRLTAGAAAAAPSLASGESRTFVVSGLCGIPAGAKALSVNLTATNARSDGGLELNAGGAGQTGLAVVDFVAGRTRANNAIVSLAPDGSIVVTNASPGIVDFVLDVNGYFQ